MLTYSVSMITTQPVWAVVPVNVCPIDSMCCPTRVTPLYATVGSHEMMSLANYTIHYKPHELGITRQTLYRHLSPEGQLRPDGLKLMNRGHAG